MFDKNASLAALLAINDELHHSILSHDDTIGSDGTSCGIVMPYVPTPVDVWAGCVTLLLVSRHFSYVGT